MGKIVYSISLLLIACGTAPQQTDQGQAVPIIKTASGGQEHWPESFGLGRKASQKEIMAKDIDVRPDGKGLPAGSGTVAAGRMIYAAKCAACHGTATTDGTYGRLFDARHPDSSRSTRTVGNYWPYATTLYDYIHRAMPFTQPGSLTPEEVYSVTAYILHANRIIPEDTRLSARNLPAIVMPAHERFIPDDRKGGPEIR